MRAQWLAAQGLTEEELAENEAGRITARQASQYGSKMSRIIGVVAAALVVGLGLGANRAFNRHGSADHALMIIVGAFAALVLAGITALLVSNARLQRLFRRPVTA